MSRARSHSAPNISGKLSRSERRTRARTSSTVHSRQAEGGEGGVQPGGDGGPAIDEGVVPVPDDGGGRGRSRRRGGDRHAVAFLGPPWTWRAKRSKSRRVTGPTLPSPTGAPSRRVIGFTKEVAEVRKASRARRVSSKRERAFLVGDAGLGQFGDQRFRGCSRAGSRGRGGGCGARRARPRSRTRWRRLRSPRRSLRRRGSPRSRPASRAACRARTFGSRLIALDVAPRPAEVGPGDRRRRPARPRRADRAGCA